MKWTANEYDTNQFRLISLCSLNGLCRTDEAIVWWNILERDLELGKHAQMHLAHSASAKQRLLPCGDVIGKTPIAKTQTNFLQFDNHV